MSDEPAGPESKFTTERRRREIIVWIGKSEDAGNREPQFAPMIPELTKSDLFNGNSALIRGLALDLVDDDLLRPSVPGIAQRMFQTLTYAELIQRDRKYASEILAAGRLTPKGRELYVYYTKPPWRRLVDWLALRQIIVGVLMGVLATALAPVVVRFLTQGGSP